MTRAPRQRSTARDLVVWRDGVHIEGTAIWCDATRARDVCFVSSAHAIAPRPHGQLIGTRETLAQLARSDHRTQPHSQLSVPYGRPFTLGTLRLELIRSGHALGGASLLASVDGHRVVYAGAVDPDGAGLGGAAELRACDDLAIDATYGDPRYRFPPASDAIAATLDFARDVVDRGGIAVLLVTSASKGLDVADRVAGAGLPVAAHRVIHHAAQRLRALDVALPPLKRFAARAPKPQVLLWPTDRAGAVASVRLPAASRRALVSGRAVAEEAVRAACADTGFAWSNRADHDRLVAYIDESGARRVYLTSATTAGLASALTSRARQVHALGPPEQMSLF